jgi:hypothetical protein
MDAIFKKMNFKSTENVVVLNPPSSFEFNLNLMEGLATILHSLDEVNATEFILAFCTKQAEVDSVANQAVAKLSSDGLLWFAYPKGTSKLYKCDFNRDTGWEVLGKLGFEPVRAVAIDEDWSALRFRKVGYIKKMTRSSAITEEGKERISKNKA